MLATCCLALVISCYNCALLFRCVDLYRLCVLYTSHIWRWRLCCVAPNVDESLRLCSLLNRTFCSTLRLCISSRRGSGAMASETRRTMPADGVFNRCDSNWRSNVMQGDGTSIIGRIMCHCWWWDAGQMVNAACLTPAQLGFVRVKMIARLLLKLEILPRDKSQAKVDRMMTILAYWIHVVLH